MNINFEQIKQAAYMDELEKIATKNPVAAYGIKGSTIGAGIGGTGAALLAFKLLKRVGEKVKKTPIIAASTVAGAIAGAKIGGNIGASYGGAYKGTHDMYNVNYGH